MGLCIYMYIYLLYIWVWPPPSNSGKIDPGGHCYWEGAIPNIHIYIYIFVGFLRGGCSREGNWGTLRILAGKIGEP